MALFTAAESLKMAMEIEKNGEVFYRAVAARATDASVKALFEDLAAQERGHYLAFQKMAEHVSEPPQPLTEYDEYQVYLRAALDSALFAGPDKALAIAGQAQDRSTALRMAIGFEKDTLLFFYDLREMAGAAEHKTVSGIIQEEKQHVRRLASLLPPAR
jgi:rubrerythrin